MNFKKDSIFSKSDKIKAEKQLHSGVLAVWGSPASGKTVVATKIAKYLSDKKKNVVLLLCDMTCPMLPCICPPSDLENDRSLGSILAAPHVNEALVKYHMVTHKKNEYLTVLGLQKGENEYTYTPFSDIQAKELIASLRKIAPYVVIDCSSYIANDILSAVSLLESDYILRLANCDLKSVSYLSSQLPILKNAGLDFDKQYKCLSNIKSNQGVAQIDTGMGIFTFKLPYSAEVEQQYLEGNLLSELNLKSSKAFRKEIEKTVREVFG